MNELQKLESFKHELAIAESYNDIKLIKDAASAYQKFQKDMKVGIDGQNRTGRFINAANAKLGQWLNEKFPSNKAGRIGTKSAPINMPTPKKESANARKMIDEQARKKAEDAVVAKGGIITTRSTLREMRDETTPETITLPDNIYSVIYADPPWSYGNQMHHNMTEPTDYYPTMKLQDICDIDIKSISAPNSVLFMWTTSPHLEESFEVVQDWGFKYKTSFIWDKMRHNVGHYNSVRHEILLVCVRGSYTPEIPKLYPSILSIDRKGLKHSEKPEEFRNIIDSLYPSGNRIELFARKTTGGWDVFGNEV